MLRLIWFSVFYCLTTGFAGGSSPSTFPPPSELDKMLDSDPLPIPVTGDTAVSAAPAAVFQVQLGALPDLDSAQARKAALEPVVGGKIEIVFDPPYYKLRFGKFATRQEAEDELVELSGKDIQGFVVRQ